MDILALVQAGAGIGALITRLVAAAAGPFYWWVLRPARRASRRPLPTHGTALWAAGAALLLFAFALPEPWLQWALLTGQSFRDAVADSSTVAQLVAETRFGRLWLAHQVVALSLTSILALVALREGRSRGLWLAASVAGALLPALAAMSGHTATYGAVALVTHLLHWGAATVWVGGIAHLLVVAWISLPPARLASVAAAFSPVALAAAVVTMATGAVNGWLYVPSLSSFVSTSYGGWLLIKFALIVGMLVLAAYNGLVMVPRFVAGREQPGSFRLTVGAEGVIAAGVLAAAQRVARQPLAFDDGTEHVGRAGRIALELVGPAGIAAALIAVAGIALAWAAWRKAQRTGLRALAAVGLGVALGVAGTALAVGSVLVPSTPWNAEDNPMPPRADALQLGKQLYESYCAICHGEDGKGGGFLASSLRRPPADLTGGHAAARTDGDLMWIVTNGVQGTEMPPFSFLTESERWAIVHHLRVLQGQIPD